MGRSVGVFLITNRGGKIHLEHKWCRFIGFGPERHRSRRDELSTRRQGARVDETQLVFHCGCDAASCVGSRHDSPEVTDITVIGIVEVYNLRRVHLHNCQGGGFVHTSRVTDTCDVLAVLQY